MRFEMQQITVNCFGCLLLSLCLAAGARVNYLSDHTSNGACEIDDGYSAFNGTIWEQLTPWLGGITRQHLEGAADLVRDAYRGNRFGQQFDVPGNLSGFYGWEVFPYWKLNQTGGGPDFPWSTNHILKLAIINGTVYLPHGPMIISNDHMGSFAAPNVNYRWALAELLEVSKLMKLPDVEMIVASDDPTLVHGPSPSTELVPPVFSTSSAKAAYDLILPDSYPVYFENLWYDDFMDSVIKQERVSWSEMAEKVIGRYNLFCGAHIPQASQHHPLGCPREEYGKLNSSAENTREGLMDIGLTYFAEIIGQPNAPYIPMEAQLAYKYVLNLDGFSISARLPWLLANEQVVLKDLHAEYQTFFSDALKPWIHYVPVGTHHYADIFDVVRYLRANQDIAYKIRENGRQFAQQYLSTQARHCYIFKLLTEYASLQRFEVGSFQDYPLAVTLEEELKRTPDYINRKYEEAMQQA